MTVRDPRKLGPLQEAVDALTPDAATLTELYQQLILEAGAEIRGIRAKLALLPKRQERALVEQLKAEYNGLARLTAGREVLRGKQGGGFTYEDLLNALENSP